jgi:geranylgeranyl diphosphate synthase type I
MRAQSDVAYVELPSLPPPAIENPATQNNGTQNPGIRDAAAAASSASGPSGHPLLYAALGSRWDAEAGRLGEMARHALLPMGKLFRPVLLLEAALAVGGRIETVLPAAVGTEGGHVASLVHDDIIDDDAVRRGRPSVQAKFGVGDAIVAGDALIFDLFLTLAECRERGAEPDRIVRALEIVAKAGLDLCRGQMLEAELTATGDRDLDRYILMISGKTGALFRGACQSGAVLAGGDDEQVDGLGVYGDELGIAFQMCDDLFAYMDQGDDVVGKPALSDIRNRRMTLPIILAYQNADARVEQDLDRAMNPDTDESEAYELLRTTMKRTGALEAARSQAIRHAATAADALSVLPPTPSRDRLAEYVRLAVTRIK